MKRQTIVYGDEINEDFSPVKHNQVNVDENFDYIHKNPFYKLATFIVYRVIMHPFSYCYMKIHSHLRVMNKSVFNEYKNKPCFIYGNHTGIPDDAFIPNVINKGRKNYFVVSSANIAKYGTKNLIIMLGGIPIPTKVKGMRNFLGAISTRLNQNGKIIIYPEAHIWPYCTFIRNYPDDSFRYPGMYKVPCFAFTTTFQKRKLSSRPRTTVYCDGPFFPDYSLSSAEQRKQLRDQVYHAMAERSRNSNYQYINYVKKEKTI